MNARPPMSARSIAIRGTAQTIPKATNASHIAPEAIRCARPNAGTMRERSRIITSSTNRKSDAA